MSVVPTRSSRKAWGFSRSLLALALCAGCASGGQYGFSRAYEPLSDEEDAAEGTREFDPVMIEREPESWRGSKLSIFGVVKGRTQAPGGGAYLTLSVRRLQDRNLCDDMADDTCRVTVTE